MTPWIAALLLATTALPARAESPAGAAATQPAIATAEAAIGEVLEVLRQKDATTDAKLGALQKILDERFDFPLMSRLVLGRARRSLDAAQQSEFEREFRQHLTLTYGRSIERFSDESIEVTDARPERNGDVTVATRIRGGNADNTAVDYRMRGRDGNWVVIDVIIEGVSVVQNFRAQVRDIVGAKGADQLIATLREKNARDSARQAAAPGDE